MPPTLPLSSSSLLPLLLLLLLLSSSPLLRSARHTNTPGGKQGEQLALSSDGHEH